MKFSVLLPTRNGGRFLDDCIRSILGEDADIELIVSDNANSDETPAVLDRWRHDPRLKALRLETPVPVTDNWNNALRAARGDYLLMMGDDDCLLPGYFRRIELILQRYREPDCVLYNGYSFVAPGSIWENQQSYYSEWHFRYGDDFLEEKVLNIDLRRTIVRDMFRFRVRIPLNMQTILVRRESAELVPGGMFKAPFPDHFALNALMLLAMKWVYVPDRLVVVGVSPKSFGHYIYSNKQSAGLAYLGIDAKFPGRLPGSELLNGMYVWLNLLKAAFPEELGEIEINRGGYVRRQVYAWLMQWKLGTIGAGECASRLAFLSGRDWLGLAASVLDGQSWVRLFRMFGGKERREAEQQWNGLLPLPEIGNIADFARWVVSQRGDG